MSAEHDAIADRLAKKFRAKHYRTGFDVRKHDLVIEVALSEQQIRESVKKLKGSKVKRRYVAVRHEEIDKATKLARGTGVGVMNMLGEIRKRTKRCYK